MNISSSNAMIYAREFDGKVRYRTAIVKKNDDNKYERGYIDIKFPKGTELENKTKIKIKKGFMSFYKNKEEKDIFYLVVQEFEVIGEFNEEKKTEDPYEKFGTQISVEDLDEEMELPF